jgi:alkanesulfonate monooxygenase SsuD/methylene tetrahydromethanopterin reductase-like flavin-dependent oxidoreductase (luciferase family)
LRESLDVCTLMLAGERFDYTGEHFRLEGAIGRPVPTQSHVPIHIGGAGPKLTMPLVRDFADWWNCPSYGVDRLAELRPLAGDARVSVQRPVGLALDDAGRDEVVTMSERRFGAWGGLVSGTATEIAEVLAADVAAGAEGFVLPFTDFATAATLEHFMAEVAPAV